jgi:hypothetical protein
MIVVRDDGLKPEAILSRNQIKPEAVPCGARAAVDAAEAVLLGEADVDQASSRFGVPAATVETWMRAKQSAGLTPRAARKAD